MLKEKLMHRAISRILFALLFLGACGTKAAATVEEDAADVAVADSAADATPDAADAPDAADVSDAADVPLADIPDVVSTTDCGQIVKDWAVFVAAHSACTADGDCQVVGGAMSCDYGTPIGAPSGDAIAKSAKAAADAYLTAFYGPACAAYRDGKGVWDAAPATNLRCEAGACKADSASCLVPPDTVDADSGSDSDSTVDADAADTSGGLWTLFSVTQGGFCAPNSDCNSTWLISPTGDVQATKGGVKSNAVLTGADLATLNAAIDNLAFLNKMKSGFTCGMPPTDVGVSFSYALSGVKYNQDVTGCAFSGGVDGPLVQGIVALVKKY